jgi:predicted ATP-binding protein involved in virulence
MKKYRAISTLSQKSAKGDIQAKFSLANFYDVGHYVNEDKDKANELFEELKNLSCDFCIKVENIKVFNFRRLLEVDIPIHPRLTVFVGNNGFGKTTILDALSKSLSWVTANLIKENNSGSFISPLDINNLEEAEYASITTIFTIDDKKKYTSTIAKENVGAVAKQSGEHAEIKALSDLYRYLHSSDCNFDLPIIVSYPIARANEVKPLDLTRANKLADIKNWGEFDAYDKSLSDPQDFAVFMAWLIRFEKIAKQDETEVISIEQEIKGYKNLLIDPDISNTFSEDAKFRLNGLINEKKEQLVRIRSISSQASSSMVVHTVYSALSTFLEEFTNFRIQHSSDKVDLLVDKDGVTLSALQLSQGEKSLMALVGDIARRLVMLNKNKKDPLSGNGIVLIDEIDLHLHPSWQQEVIPKLLKTFPKIQFIISTHSPQVLTTVYPESIRKIVGFKGKSAIEIPDFSYGAESKRTLEDIQGVPSRPANTDLIKKLNRYKELVSQDEWDTNEAKTLKDSLLGHYNEHDPIMVRLDMDVRMRKRRKEKVRK